MAEAQARRDARARAAESVRLQLRLRTQERLSQLRATEGIARLYADGIVPPDRMSFEAAVAIYQAPANYLRTIASSCSRVVIVCCHWSQVSEKTRACLMLRSAARASSSR